MLLSSSLDSVFNNCTNLYGYNYKTQKVKNILQLISVYLDIPVFKDVQKLKYQNKIRMIVLSLQKNTTIWQQ